MALNTGVGEPEWGQQVDRCLALADYTIMNDGSIEDLDKKTTEVMQKIIEQ